MRIPSVFSLQSAALILCALPAQAEEPHAVLSGPAAVQAGDILEVSAEQSTGTRFAFEVFPFAEDDTDGARLTQIAAELQAAGWTVVEPGNGERPSFYRVHDGDRTITLPSHKGDRYVVFLAVAGDDGQQSTCMLVTPTVGGEAPPPPEPNPGPGPDPAPNPQPGPEPGPNVPDGPFHVGQQIYDWALEVQTDDRAGQASQIANHLQSVASAIAAGTLRGDAAIVRQLKSGLTGKTWSPLWAVTFGLRLAKLLSDLLSGGLSADDWIGLLTEIAAALLAIPA